MIVCQKIDILKNNLTPIDTLLHLREQFLIVLEQFRQVVQFWTICFFVQFFDTYTLNRHLMFFEQKIIKNFNALHYQPQLTSYKTDDYAH